jgi:hypothetical protein
MQTTRSRAIVLASVAVALTFAGAAAGFTAGQVFQVQSGDRADIHIRGAIWSCSSTRGQYVTCQSGDASPYVELGGSTWPCKCVTVKVFTLRDPQGGHVIRTYENGHPVYIFRAL